MAQLADFIGVVSKRYDKDVMIMEAAFNWSPALPNGYPGQLADNGPYPAAMSSPAGQQRFVEELLSTLRRTPRAGLQGPGKDLDEALLDIDFVGDIGRLYSGVHMLDDW